MARLFITYRQREQAERMAAKWDARAAAFWNHEMGGTDEGWGFKTAGYCKTFEDAELAENLAQRIYLAIDRILANKGGWEDVLLIRDSVAERDRLDAGLATTNDFKLMKGR